MKAMVLNQLADITANSAPLTLEEWPTPVPKGDEILVQVSACGVCHTEIDEIEGRTPPPQLPIILGHQVVGTIAARGPQATQYDIGARVGVAWIFAACGDCAFCRTGDENLCPDFKATGRDADGGYAQFMTVPQGFATTIPDEFNDVEAAPLLCAGAIGYRSLELTGIKEGQILGLTGFGASAHLVLKLANYRYPNSPIFVFARSREKQRFAKSLGATWAGDTTDSPPAKIDGIIDTTPAWKPVLAALENLKPGGRLVINAIRKEKNDSEQLLQLDYADHLWMEKEIKSVANVTRRDVTEFLHLAVAAGIKPTVQAYPLASANEALCDLKTGRGNGAKVLYI